jgi:hypothetical protein
LLEIVEVGFRLGLFCLSFFNHGSVHLMQWLFE